VEYQSESILIASGGDVFIRQKADQSASGGLKGGNKICSKLNNILVSFWKEHHKNEPPSVNLIFIPPLFV